MTTQFDLFAAPPATGERWEQPFDLSPFDAVEVHPVCEDAERVCEGVEEGDPSTSFWSVYLHRRGGGVECIADCPSREIAFAIAAALECAWPEPLTEYGANFLALEG